MKKNAVSRSAFTLVELLVSIAIILVIIAISLPIIMLTLQNLEETRACREVKLLDQACEQFKAVFGRYPPGRIMLCEDMRGYRMAIEQHLCQGQFQDDPMHQKALAHLASISMEYLQSIFPGIDLNAGHDWNGDGVIDDRQYILSGNEALTFFLGGMRYGTGAVDISGSNRTMPLGFSTDKTHPTVRSTSARLGPYFEFEASQILYEVTSGKFRNENYPSPAGSPMDHGWTVGVSTGYYRNPGEQFIGFFARYTDLWGTPYAYFSARGNQIDNYSYMCCPWCFKLGLTVGVSWNYHMWFSDFFWMASPPEGSGMWHPHPLGWSDFTPYIDNFQAGHVKYHNAHRFQIVSAGRDKQFGSGGFLKLTSSEAESSAFENYQHFTGQNIYSSDDKKANYDNINNITFRRAVPRP